MGPPHIARGPAADNYTRAWAHRITIKIMSPTPGIKFSRGPGQRVKAFLLRWNVDLKKCSLKTVDWKIFKQVSGSYLRSKASPYAFLAHFFRDTVPLKRLSNEN
jgi:hypothetical protein